LTFFFKNPLLYFFQELGGGNEARKNLKMENLVAGV